MRKHFLTALAATIVNFPPTVEGGTFLCLFGPDSAGEYAEEVVNETVANKCGKFCICNEVQPKCLFGPDGTGDFVIKKVAVEFSDKCDRSFCTCTDHEDY